MVKNNPQNKKPVFKNIKNVNTSSRVVQKSKNTTSKNIIKKKPHYSKKIRVVLTLSIFLLSYLFLYFLFVVNYSIIIRVVLAFLTLIISGIAITRLNAFDGDHGLYLLSGTKGINFIERLSNWKKGFWIFLSEWGLVLSFGILSYFIFKNKISKKALLIGLLSIFILISVVLPYFLLSFQFISLPNLPSLNIIPSESLIGSYTLSSTGILLLIVTFIGGFSLFLFSELIIASGSTIINIFTVASSIAASAPNYAPLSTSIPALAPIIPGIDIPLLAGILSLAVILIVHEFSHGVLSKIYKISIKRVGLVLLGVIPMGAFVEPDENKVLSSEDYKQTNIFIAGVSANFLLTFIFFIFTVIFLIFVVPNIYTNNLYISGVVPNSSAYNVIPVGSSITSWNNISITNYSTLISIASKDKPNSLVTVGTNNATYKLHTNSTGKIGVLINQNYIQQKGILVSILAFLYQFIILSLTLNFLIATVNLLPLPSFDGWRVYKVLLKDDKKLKYLSIITIIIFVLLALPWLFII